MKAKGTAVWSGSGKKGSGYLSTRSKALDNKPYSFETRFGTAIGTNPEELISAAHAGCFTMKLAFILEEAGFVAEELTTVCDVKIENGTITTSELMVAAKVPGILAEQFYDAVKNAEQNCPVSKMMIPNVHVEAKGELINH